MKRTGVVTAGALVVILVGAFWLRGQPAPADNDPKKGTRTITSNGSAAVLGKVDSARVYFGVTTFAKTVDGARADNARIVNKVREAIVALGLDAPKSRTIDTSVAIQLPDKLRDQEGGFNVSHSFTILVKDADPEKLSVLAGRVLDAGLKNGVNSGTVEFFKEDDSELRRQAMTKAVEDALANAKAFANGANVKILEVSEIDGSEDRSSAWAGGSQANGIRIPGGNAEATSPAVGMWKVTR